MISLYIRRWYIIAKDVSVSAEKSDRQKKKYTIYIVLIALRLFSDHINHCLIIGAAGKIANLLDIFYSIIIA